MSRGWTVTKVPTGLTWLENERDGADQALEDLAERRSMIVLHGSEAEVDEHARRVAAWQERYNEAIVQILRIRAAEMHEPEGPPMIDRCRRKPSDIGD